MKAINTQSNFKTINFLATRGDSLYYTTFNVQCYWIERNEYCCFFSLVLFGGGVYVSETKLCDYAGKFASRRKFFN